MTNEEAISLLKLKLNWSSTREQEAIKLAIDALKYKDACDPAWAGEPVAWLVEWPWPPSSAILGWSDNG